MSRKRNRRSKRPVPRGERKRRAARGLSPGALALYDLLAADPQLADSLGLRVHPRPPQAKEGPL